jgi:hypothetical protein
VSTPTLNTDTTPRPSGPDVTGGQPDGATEALVERLFDAVLGTMDLFAIALGERLGLYAAVHEHGPCTSAQLAAVTGIAERYAREWLEQQAVTGILEVSGTTAAGRR